MLVSTFECGPLATNCYLVADRPDGGVATVIDAPLDATPLLVAQARRWGVTIQTLINTHAHWDHVLDNDTLLQATGAKLALHRADEPLLRVPQPRLFGFDLDMPVGRPDFFLTEGTPVALGKSSFEIWHCPGHSPGSVVVFERHERVAFVGDVLFAGSIGRTDLPGGDHAALLRSIHDKLLPLGDDVKVLPGHGPATTLGMERQTNPFLTK